jgi:hypothetical protein
MFTHWGNGWGCGIQIVDEFSCLRDPVRQGFGLYAIPSLRFGAASIPQLFIGKSLFIFYRNE